MQRISKNALMHQSTITYNIINIDSIWQWHTIIATIVLVIASTEIGTLWRTGQLHNEKELGLFTQRNPALGWISREERLVARGSWLPRKTHHHSGSWPSLFWWHEERVSLRAWPVCCAAWSHCKQIQKRKHHIASKYDSMVLFRSKSACDGLQFFHCQRRTLLWRKRANFIHFGCETASWLADCWHQYLAMAWSCPKSKISILQYSILQLMLQPASHGFSIDLCCISVLRPYLGLQAQPRRTAKEPRRPPQTCIVCRAKVLWLLCTCGFLTSEKRENSLPWLHDMPWYSPQNKRRTKKVFVCCFFLLR